MTHEFLSMKDVGTRTLDIIMSFRWKPSQLRWWIGARVRGMVVGMRSAFP